MVEMFASAIDPADGRTSALRHPQDEEDAAQPKRLTRFDRIFRSVRRVFIWSCYASGVSVLAWILFFAAELIFPSLIVDQLGRTDTMTGLIASVIFGFFGIAIPALTPFVSLTYMGMVLFKGSDENGSEFWLTTFALLTGALALALSLNDDICTGFTTDAQTCFRLKWGFVLDQFSKGSFADIFDIYQLNLSPLPLEKMQGLTTVYVLNFRLISAAYLVNVIISLNRRLTARRERRRLKAMARQQLATKN